jgi:hypothetical protein
MSEQRKYDRPNEIVKTALIDNPMFKALMMNDLNKTNAIFWKKCIVPNCSNKVCLSAENNEHLCYQHYYYGKPVKIKRIKKDRKKGLVP